MTEIDLLPRDEFNARLVANTHPPDWKNPAPQPLYDLVVIGGGTAGLVSAASRLSTLSSSPLTNAGDFSVLNCLASSTASFTATFGGVRPEVISW